MKKIPEEVIDKMFSMYQSGTSVTNISKELCVSENIIYKKLNPIMGKRR